MRRGFPGAVALAMLLAPMAATAQTATGGAATDVMKEVTPAGETVAVPEAPPGAAAEAAVESDVEREIKGAEKAVEDAQRDLQGGGSVMQGEVVEPVPTVPSTGG